SPRQALGRRQERWQGARVAHRAAPDPRWRPALSLSIKRSARLARACEVWHKQKLVLKVSCFGTSHMKAGVSLRCTFAISFSVTFLLGSAAVVSEPSGRRLRWINL